MKFRCISCNHVFEADKDSYVTCPQCQSDNVTPINISSRKYLYSALGTLLVALTTYFILEKVNSEKKTKNTNEVVIDSASPGSIVEDNNHIIDEIQIPAVENEVEVVNIIEIENTVPKYSKSGYSFTVNCKNLPQGIKVCYILNVGSNGEEIAKSETGKFENVKPSPMEDGSYELNVINAEKGISIANKQINGFDKQPEIVVPKISQAELQNMIDARDTKLFGHNPSISDNLVLVFNNLKEGENKPKNISEIYNKFTMEFWKSIKIVSLSYNSDNVITQIVMDIEHIEYDF